MRLFVQSVLEDRGIRGLARLAEVFRSAKPQMIDLFLREFPVPLENKLVIELAGDSLLGLVSTLGTSDSIDVESQRAYREVARSLREDLLKSG